MKVIIGVIVGIGVTALALWAFAGGLFTDALRAWFP